MEGKGGHLFVLQTLGHLLPRLPGITAALDADGFTGDVNDVRLVVPDGDVGDTSSHDVGRQSQGCPVYALIPALV